MQFIKTVSASLLAFAFVPVAQAARLPVGDFFKDPEFRSVSLSPTGEYITVSKPVADRTLLAAFRVSDMKLVGKWDYGQNKHIDSVRWVNDDRFFMYVSEKTGRFDRTQGMADLFASNVDGSKRTTIPNGGTYGIADVVWEDPKHVLVQRSIDSAYLFRMNVYDGSTRTIATAPLRFGGFVLDHDQNVRYAVGQEESNEAVVLRREGDGWKEVHRTEMGGPMRRPYGFAPDNKRVIFSISDDGEPARYVFWDPESKQETLLSRNPRVDAVDFLVSSDEKNLLALEYLDGTPGYEFVDPEHPESKVYAGLINAFPNHAVRFDGISRDGNLILILAYSDVDPGSYYLFNRKTGQATFLLAAMDWIDPAKMSEMKPITVTARDGLELHGYLTIPRGSDGKNLPLILHPHGGPHGPRDEWRFNPEVQFLANRGYAVLQINFRGSGGYGSKFESMGYRSWGTTMIDDMLDAVNWTVEQGIADPNRLCSYGASYGGYAALQTVVRYPETFRCTIGYVGLYSMDLWMKDSDVAERESGRNYQLRVFPEDSAGRAAQSPAFQIDKINIPVMLVHGAKDMRVPISQFNLLNKKLTEAGKPPEVTVVEKKEGHGFYDYQNQVDLYTKMEAFLDRHIGPSAKVAGN